MAATAILMRTLRNMPGPPSPSLPSQPNPFPPHLASTRPEPTGSLTRPEQANTHTRPEPALGLAAGHQDCAGPG